MNKGIFFIVLCLVVASLSGCALTTERIELQYPQRQGISQIPGANHVCINVQVNDQRQDKSKVSCKKNSLGIEMAAILATEDVTVSIRRFVEKELLSRGFQLGSDTANVQVVANLTRFYNDFKCGFFSGNAVADFNMSVAVESKKGDLLYSRQIIAQGTEPNIQLASGENASRALNRALKNGIKSLFEDQDFLSALMASTSN